MDIEITQFFEHEDAGQYSASIAELGDRAGAITWGNACNAVDDYLFLDTPEKLEALRDHVRGFGAWSTEEIDGWDSVTCNALFLQLVSGDMREAGLNDVTPDWEEYERLAHNGQCSSNIYHDEDTGQVFYHLGN